MVISLRDQAAIVGIGDLPYTTRSGLTGLELMLRAARAAMADAGLERGDLDGIMGLSPNVTAEDYVANQGLRNIRYSASVLRFDSPRLIALQTAAMAIATGQARYVLVAMGRDFASDRHITLARHQGATPQMRKAAEFNYVYGDTTSLINHALRMRLHMDAYGTTEAHLAKVIVNQYRHAALNPNALVHEPVTHDWYFAQPYLAEPLRRPDNYLYADSAGAFIVGPAERARDGKARPVYVSGVAMTFSNYPYAYSSLIGDRGENPLARGARAALGMAGVTLKDLDFAQLYDSLTPLVIFQLGNLGLCPPEEIAGYLDSVSLAFGGGGLPVNTHGGHLAQGMAQGQSHDLEAVRQLHGEAVNRQVPDAEIGIVTATEGAAAVLRR
jgi:acetyl-CoA acetyltransferase